MTIQIVEEGDVPNSRDKVGSATLTIVPSNTDMVNANATAITALQLEGDNALKNVAGSLAATEAEKKMKEYCAKVGIVEGVFNYVFNSDSTFTSALKRGSLKGTYSVSPEDKTVTLRYTVGNKKLTVSTLTAHVVLSGNELTLLFNADKLLKFLSTVSSISSNTTLKAINKLASEYDGMMLGFDLKK